MSGSSESSMEEEEEEEETTPVKSKFNSRQRTDSFDEMVSDELEVALAMMRVNSLSSLNDKQRERVEKLRAKIKAGGDDSNHLTSEAAKNSNFEAAEPTAMSPNEKEVLPLNATQKSSKTPSNHASPVPGYSPKKLCESGKDLPLGKACGDVQDGEVLEEGNKEETDKGIGSNVEVHDFTSSGPNDVTQTEVEAKCKTGEMAMPEQQGEFDELGNSNQLGECLENISSPEDNQNSVTSDVQKISLVELLPEKAIESKHSLIGSSSEHGVIYSTRDNTPGSVSSADRVISESSSTIKSDQGETSRRAAKSEQAKQSHDKQSKASKTRQLRKKRGRWLKGTQRFKSLPPLANMPATPQAKNNSDSASKQYFHHVAVTKPRVQPKHASSNQLLQQGPSSPGRFVLKPQFTSIAESTPRTGGFPSQYWVVEENGNRYPQIPSRNRDRISWKAVLEDVANIDGYRKIHAEKMKKQAGEPVHPVVSSAGSSSQEEMGYLQRYLKKYKNAEKKNNNNSYARIHGSSNRRLKQRHLPPLPHYPADTSMEIQEPHLFGAEENKSGPDADYPLVHVHAHSQKSLLPSSSEWKQSTMPKNRNDSYAALNWLQKR